MADSSKYWYNHPSVNAVSLLVGLVGVLLAIIFYYKSKAEREPYFSFDPQRTVLVNRALAVGDKLTVAYENNPIVGNISVVQCYFWNDGSKPIHSQDVLEPLKVVLDPGAKILETSVLRQSRPKIVDLHVSPDLALDGKRTNTASVSFLILEKQDGATMQIVYTGDPGVSVKFTGTIEGAEIREVRNVGATLTDSSGHPVSRQKMFPKIAVIMVVSVLLGAFGIAIIDALRAQHSPLFAIKSGVRSVFRPAAFFFLGAFLSGFATSYYTHFFNFRTVPLSLLTH